MLPALVFLAGVLPFVQAAGYGIVDLDDYSYLTSYAPITSGLGWEGLKFAFTHLGDSIWMPLTWLSYMIDHSLFGMDSWGPFHVHSLLLHGLNAVLVFLLMRRIAGFCFEGRPAGLDVACALAAAVWACHPLRCESVVFLASRKDVLSLLFELLALLVWLAPGERRGLGRQGFALLLFVMAGMAKPSVMTFPILAFIVDFLIRRRVRPLDYILPLALAAALGWFAGVAQAAGGATENLFGMPFWYRLVNAAVSFGLYLWNTVWPADLAPQCIIRWPGLPRFCVPGLLICAAVGGWLAWRLLCIWRRQDELVKVEWSGLIPTWAYAGERAPYLASFTWFAVAVAPMLGIAGFGYHSMADRFTYIPSIGLALAAAAWLLRLGSHARRVGMAFAVAVCAAFCVCTWRQTRFWRSDLALFSHTLEVDGDRNASAHGILANWNFEFPHDLERCLGHFDRMKSLNLRFMESCFQVYVFALCEAGRTEEIPALLKWYDDWLERDIAQNPRWGRESSRYGFMRTIYQCARLAYLITQPDLRPVVADQLKELTCPKDDGSYLYLVWKLAEAEGRTEDAAKAKEDLATKSARKGYVQFRYLKVGRKESKP